MPDQPNTDPDFDAARALDAPLAAQLENYVGAVERNLPDVANAYQTLIDKLVEAGTGTEAPQVGDPLPAFVLPDEAGQLVSSHELLSRGPLVISFNRGHWCPFCWLELTALGEQFDAIRAAGGDIVSITPETAKYTGQLKQHLNSPLRFLSDIDNGYSLELGIAMPISRDVRALLEPLGIDLALYQKNDAWFVPLPAIFVVDGQGTVQLSYVNPDYRQRFDPAPLSGLVAELR